MRVLYLVASWGHQIQTSLSQNPFIPLPSVVLYLLLWLFFWNKDSLFPWMKTHFCSHYFSQKGFTSKNLFCESFIARMPPLVFFPQDLLISSFFFVLFSLPATLFVVLTQYRPPFEILVRLVIGVPRRMGTSQRKGGAKKAMMTTSLGWYRTFWYLGLGYGKG